MTTLSRKLDSSPKVSVPGWLYFFLFFEIPSSVERKWLAVNHLSDLTYAFLPRLIRLNH